ncbi:MAG: anthranilate synthase component I family protein [Desulfovibrio sp.]|nr:anthranilate synthase component I family protein [Desulfovibrio sp.]MBI4960703.1 anthranilate synthase component I family protein [Desulfovibrio sp.]
MTPYRCSCPVDGLSWLSVLAPQKPDVFLTPPMPGSSVSGMVGLWPVSEWRCGQDGGREGLKEYCFSTPGPALGFLSYHAGFSGLGLSLPEPDFPAGVFRKYGVVLSPGSGARTVHIFAQNATLALHAERLLRGKRCFHAEIPELVSPVRASLDREAFEQRVRSAVEHILAGNVYQLNLSIRFETERPAGLESMSLFTQLMEVHPATFYALYYDSPFTILSTSPERFIKVCQGRVLSQPIKGTRLARTPLLAEVRALRASNKEDAELSMIVDLIRNDVSPHCEYGSVGVEGHKSVFEVDGLLQMYSNVTGRLRPGSTALDLLWDALPPGSVTGCPKKRAVEIIAGLEPHHREAYCGCLVAVHGPGDLDSSVAIRTAVVDENRSIFSFHAGSGIVVDSDPYTEYEETLAKAAKFLALGRRKRQ